MNVTTIESCALSDGSVFLEKLGRKYIVTRTYCEAPCPPAGAYGLNLAQAREMFAAFIQADLLETEGN